MREGKAQEILERVELRTQSVKRLLDPGEIVQRHDLRHLAFADPYVVIAKLLMDMIESMETSKVLLEEISAELRARP